MPMTLRLPDDLDQQLAQIAEAEHVSKHSLIVSGLEELVRERLERVLVDRAVDRILERDEGLLTRLEDA